MASQPVGIVRLSLSPGANFVSTPLHRTRAYCGGINQVSVNSVAVAGTPSWVVDQFGPRDGFTQFVAILRKSASVTSAHEGEWWPVLGNTADTISVANRGEDLRSLVGPGDVVEVRHLTTLNDLFGTGSSYLLNKDANGVPNANQEDLIRFVVGTGFGTTVFYHNGSLVGEGYYVNGQGPLDGSTITVWPDQPFMVFRKAGSPIVKIACRGQVQMTRLAHYLHPGANVVGNPFPVDSPIVSSGLIQAGWCSDANGIPNAAQEDVLRPVVGTGLGAPVFHHDGRLIPAGWYVNGALNDNFPLEPGKGYFLFLTGTESFIWNQPPPFATETD